MTKIILIFVSIVFLIACETDDDDQTTPVNSTGNFKIDDDQFQLRQGFVTPTETDGPNLYRKDILLASVEYIWSQNRLIGAADTVIMTIYSDNPSFEIEGAYSITDDQVAAGRVEMYFAINYDIENDTLDQEEEIESGTLTIIRNTDGRYVFNIDNGIVDIVGNDFTLDYNGTLTLLTP